MTRQQSAIPVSPVTLHNSRGECRSQGVRGMEWMKQLNDMWVIESKYLDGLDGDEEGDMDEGDDGEAERLFGGSDSEEEDAFSRV